MPELNNFSYQRLQKLVAVVFIGCLIVLFLSGFDTIKSKSRDIKRRADIKILIKALDLYHDKYGKYPDSINDWQGWDLSIGYNGDKTDFIDRLREEGFLNKEIKDPINNTSYHYRYQKFKAGDYGCKNSFYILQIVNFELSTGNNGGGECPELNWAESAPNGYTAQDFD
ncbi:hypothetical protein HY797_02985 [Candidatus Falkowbacteria bacterium]|nr:hypothetical protein [Candidatus Falkowbacteria bacterium]